MKGIMRCTIVSWMLLICSTAIGASRTQRIAELHAPESHNTAQRITQMPGIDGLVTPQYSGYVEVDRSHGRRLFYLLVESQGDPRRDPLIIWLTGGPGCSSVDAYTYENGPFTFSFRPGSSPPFSAEDVRLSPNPFTWAREASVLYIDSPAGTGLSYSLDSADYFTNDTRTIDDLAVFLDYWVDLFPEFLDQDVYIAGESYAGVYVPLLAQRVLDENARVARGGAASAWQRQLPLRGYIVGNGVTDDEVDGNAQVPFAWGMALVGPDQHARVEDACRGRYWDASPDSECGKELAAMEAAMGDINPYAILDDCTFHRHRGTASAARLARARGALTAGGAAHRGGWPLSGVRAAPAGGRLRHAGGLLGHTISCGDRSHALLYYNAPAVRGALHAASLEVAGRWEPCSDVLHYAPSAGSMIPVHRDLLARGMRALILSGDHDYVVPFTGTRAWVAGLGLQERAPWHAWHVGEQVAGYAVEYEGGLVFATVKGAGHMVPQTKPEASLRLLHLFLSSNL